MRCRRSWAAGFSLLVGSVLTTGPAAPPPEIVNPGGPRRVAGGVGADATTYTVTATFDPVRAVDPATDEEVTARPEVPEAVAAARAACETDLRAALEEPPPPPAFRDVRIERPFDTYLTASPLLMELGGAAVVDAGGGETLLVGVARVVLTDGSAGDVLRAERVCTLKARAAAVGERDGARISYLRKVEDRVVVVADAAGERARSVSDRLTVTRETIEGVAKGLPVVGRWRSADGAVFHLAVGGRLTGPPRAEGKSTSRTPVSGVAPPAGRPASSGWRRRGRPTASTEPRPRSSGGHAG